jgi:hypothetical protein
MKIKLTKIKNLIKDKIKSLKKEKSSGKNDSIGSSGSIILTEYSGIDTNQSSDTIKQEEIGADKPRGFGGSGGACGPNGRVGGVGEIVCSDIFFVDTYKCSCGKKIDFRYSIREQSKQD